MIAAAEWSRVRRNRSRSRREAAARLEVFGCCWRSRQYNLIINRLVFLLLAAAQPVSTAASASPLCARGRGHCFGPPKMHSLDLISSHFIPSHLHLVVVVAGVVGVAAAATAGGPTRCLLTIDGSVIAAGQIVQCWCAPLPMAARRLEHKKQPERRDKLSCFSSLLVSASKLEDDE